MLLRYHLRLHVHITEGVFLTHDVEILVLSWRGALRTFLRKLIVDLTYARKLVK